jgi:hypothetical protein
MITTLLTNISSLFTRVLVVGMLPLLAFLLLHTLMFTEVFAPAKSWVGMWFEKPDAVTLSTLTALLILITLAYVWSSLSVFLREILEGRVLKPEWADFLGTRYASELRECEAALQTARDQLEKLAKKDLQWDRAMREARQRGATTNNCNYQRRVSLANLLEKNAEGEDVTAAQIDAEVSAFVTVLENNSPDILGNPSSDALDDDYIALRRLSAYARERWATKAAQALEAVELDFAGSRPAATRMGNIAQSTAYYAQSRYGINLDVFWPRFQDALNKNDKFRTQLDDANTRLDFVISLYWQTFLFTLLWTLVLPFWGDSIALFLVVAIGGVIACLLWYRVARENYRGLAAIMRASIDLHRHSVLDVMKIEAPAGLEEERALWSQLEQHIAYNSRKQITFKAAR